MIYDMIFKVTNMENKKKSFVAHFHEPLDNDLWHPPIYDPHFARNGRPRQVSWRQQFGSDFIDLQKLV